MVKATRARGRTIGPFSVRDDWEDKDVFLTEKAARSSYRANGHHLTEPRTYVKHFWRNSQMELVMKPGGVLRREAGLAMTPNPDFRTLCLALFGKHWQTGLHPIPEETRWHPRQRPHGAARWAKGDTPVPFWVM